jgi:hypothetical protein
VGFADGNLKNKNIHRRIPKAREGERERGREGERERERETKREGERGRKRVT